MLLPLILAQAAPTAAPPAPPSQRWSIMTDPCARASDGSGQDVVVCGHPDQVQPRIPLPAYRGPPDHPVASNPDMVASVALNGPGIGNECGAYGENCEPAGGGYITPMTAIAGAVDVARRAFATRKYKNKGTPIPLDEPAPTSLAGHVLP
jgi:hypothetical protein